MSRTGTHSEIFPPFPPFFVSEHRIAKCSLSYPIIESPLFAYGICVFRIYILNLRVFSYLRPH